MTQKTIQGAALITGASSGIGATYADRLAKRGHDLILVARDQTRLEDLATRLRAEAGVKVEVLPADLTARADLLKIEQRLRSDDSIGLLVNNAGLGPKGPLLGGDIDYLDTMIALNVTAANRLAIAAGDAFAARGRGAIVNIASVVTYIPEHINGAYSGTKAFVHNLTLALNAELAPHDVRVQAVLPGLTRTEIFDRAGGDVAAYDPSMVMEVGDLVDAALAGLDQGELVTIPSLPDPADFTAVEAARGALAPNLSKDRPAERYKTGA